MRIDGIDGKLVGTFKDKYGDDRQIIRRRNSTLTVANISTTPTMVLNRAAAPLIGEEVKRRREALGMTLEELGKRAGLAGISLKERVWEIENSIRGQGIRMGTLYALACALGVEACDLLPTTKQVIDAAKVKLKATKSLSL